MLTPEQDATAEAAAEAIVAAARALYPDDPERFVRCALYGALSLQAAWPERPIVSVESPSMSPAELERRLASPGAKWSR